MSKRTLLAAVAVAVAGLFGAAQVSAQEFPDYKVDLGISGGVSGYTAMLEDVRMEAGWIVGTQATFWLTPGFGIRANGGYTERNLAEGGFFDAGEPFHVLDVNQWTVTGDLMWRWNPDGYAMGSARSVPYLTGGFGARYFDMAGEGEVPGTDERGVTFDAPDGGRYSMVEKWEPAGRVGIGTDFRLADAFGLRLELGDLIWGAPLQESLRQPRAAGDDAGDVVHEIYASLGANILLGLEAPEVVAVAPAPPAPEPEPEPEPEPVEEMIQVCVIDPSADAGIMQVDAIYLPETRDTLVMRNGMRQDFATAVPSVMVANEAEWFVRGEPLTVTLSDGTTIEYTTWQSARMIDADRLTFVGTARGLPVYANTDDVAGFAAQWTAARRAAATNDIGDILADNSALGSELEGVQYLYVPLRPTGCVFQAVRLVEQVRKK
jgi:hypothetical protein